MRCKNMAQENDALDGLKAELERFGMNHDAAEPDRSRRMFNRTLDTLQTGIAASAALNVGLGRITAVTLSLSAL